MRCRANVFTVEARHDGLEQDTQVELGVLSEAPQVQYCAFSTLFSFTGWHRHTGWALQAHLAMG
jgi:hypothetical protein